MSKHNCGIDGPGRKTDYWRKIRAINLAMARKCPDCNRKSALEKFDPYNSGNPVYICRWCGKSITRDEYLERIP